MSEKSLPILLSVFLFIALAFTYSSISTPSHSSAQHVSSTDSLKSSAPNNTQVIPANTTITSNPPETPKLPLLDARDKDVQRLLTCLNEGVQFRSTGHYPDNYYWTQTCWTEYKRQQALRVYDVIEKLPEDSLHHFDIREQHEMFDLVPETYSCDARFMTRVGPPYPVDGGKWICTDHLPKTNEDCTIFSLGSAGDFGFEESVKKVVPHCKIHTFDCTGVWTNPTTTFHPWCLGEKDENKTFQNAYQTTPKVSVFKTWDTILKETGVERVDLLKMDIEFFEWQVLPYIKDATPDNLPTQILLEIHYNRQAVSIAPNWLNHTSASTNSAHSMIKLMRLLDSMGYRTARMEYNWFGGCCAEVVLIKDRYMLNGQEKYDKLEEEWKLAEQQDKKPVITPPTTTVPPTPSQNQTELKDSAPAAPKGDLTADDQAAFVYLFSFMVLVCLLVSYRARQWMQQKQAIGGVINDMGFKSFQRNYLIVYTIVMFSDWLQGSYIYPLYREYGYSLSQISYLFVAGFMSSAVFGTFVGSVADKWGRKKLAVAFCLIYMISCFTKLSPNYNTLIMGRVLAGIATSLLSSVFESWMVCEHYSRDYEEAWLQTTFALGTWLNGVAAIGSGIIANALVKPFGNVSPFILAALTLLVPAIIILGTWTENYGSGSTSTGAKFEDNDRGTSWWVVLKMVFSDRKIFAVGTIQFTFEAAMFCWIFLWSPVLEKAAKTSNLPFGLIFSTFMLAIMTGSMLYEILIARQWSHAGILRIACTIASLSFIICILIPATSNPHTFNFFFTLFELSVGLYYPSLSTIRSSILPEQIRSTLLNIFRVPLNLIVVIMLINIDNIPYQYLFAMLAGLSVISTWMTAAIAIDRTGQSPGKGEGKNRGRGRSKERESTNLLDGSGGKGFDGHSEMRGVHIDD